MLTDLDPLQGFITRTNSDFSAGSFDTIDIFAFPTSEFTFTSGAYAGYGSDVGSYTIPTTYSETPVGLTTFLDETLIIVSDPTAPFTHPMETDPVSMMYSLSLANAVSNVQTYTVSESAAVFSLELVTLEDLITCPWSEIYPLISWSVTAFDAGL